MPHDSVERMLFHSYAAIGDSFTEGVGDELPDGVSRAFAAVLNSATRPFHVVNYVGSLGGGRVLRRSGMVRVMSRVTRSLERSLDAEPPTRLERGMHFPVGWDPYFREWMSLRDVYHYPTQHY